MPSLYLPLCIGLPRSNISDVVHHFRVAIEPIDFFIMELQQMHPSFTQSHKFA
uniref:Uncharacterized protein n=1 Tax=Manihot esculenta TaxID=3983 RepID=A0A2C9USD8_MANES